MDESTNGNVPQSELAAQSPAARLIKYKRRTLTRRGVLWLGQKCNLRCYFCYFHDRVKDPNHPENAFLTLDKLKQMCHTLRYFYGNDSIDIQGGEPTIHPDIYELIRYCREIGLIPSLISNAQVLGNPGVAKKFKDAGVYDFLVSVHGIGEAYDTAVCSKGAYNRVIKGIEALLDAGITFRMNCTMSKAVYRTAADIARTTLKYGPKAVNFINCNTFDDQGNLTNTFDDAASFSERMPYISEAADIFEEAGVEVNFRYFPFCVAPRRHWKNIYNFQQLPYDHHEWDLESWLWTGQEFQRRKDMPLSPPIRMGHATWRILFKYERDRLPLDPVMEMFVRMHRPFAKLEQLILGRENIIRRDAKARASVVLGYRYFPACSRCALREICDGFQKGYNKLFGEEEAKPVEDMPLVDDPKRFIQEQGKYLDTYNFEAVEKHVNEVYFGAK